MGLTCGYLTITGCSWLQNFPPLILHEGLGGSFAQEVCAFAFAPPGLYS